MLYKTVINLQIIGKLPKNLILNGMIAIFPVDPRSINLKAD